MKGNFLPSKEDLQEGEGNRDGQAVCWETKTRTLKNQGYGT
jgi:hypothetical protein